MESHPMTLFTVFYSHPHYDSGHFSMKAPSAQVAGEFAAESLPEDLSEDDGDEVQVTLIRDELDVEVWAGKHYEKPAREPDWVFE